MISKNKKGAVLCFLASQPFIIKNSVNTNAIGLSTLVGIGATAWNWSKIALDYFDRFAVKGQGYMNTWWLLSSVKTRVENIYNQVRCYLNKPTLSSPAEFKKKFEEACKKIKGQEKQKRDVMYFGLNAIHDLKYYDMIVKKGKEKGNDVLPPKFLMITGTSGSGKSEMAEAFAKAYSTAPPFRLSSGSINPNSKVPVVEQLFGTGSNSTSFYGEYGRYGGYGGGYETGSEENSLITYIKRIKFGVIILNEYDKMVLLGENKVNSLDELLRAFADGQPVFVCGRLISAKDLKGKVFILTSNEKLYQTKKSLSSADTSTCATEKLFSSTGSKANLNPKLETLLLGEPTHVNENLKEIISSENRVSDSKNSEEEGKKEEKTEKKDEKERKKEQTSGAGSEAKKIAGDKNNAKENKSEDLSRTNVERDPSFLNRITKVEVNSLTLENFEEIARDQYGEDMIKYWKEYANIDLDLSRIYGPVAKKASTMPEHGRAVKVIMKNLTGLLSTTFEEYLEKRKGRKQYKPKKIIVNYDEKTNTFSIEKRKSKDEGSASCLT